MINRSILKIIINLKLQGVTPSNDISIALLPAVLHLNTGTAPFAAFFFHHFLLMNYSKEYIATLRGSH